MRHISEKVRTDIASQLAAAMLQGAATSVVPEYLGKIMDSCIRAVPKLAVKLTDMLIEELNKDSKNENSKA